MTCFSIGFPEVKRLFEPVYNKSLERPILRCFSIPRRRIGEQLLDRLGNTPLVVNKTPILSDLGLQIGLM